MDIHIKGELQFRDFIFPFVISEVTVVSLPANQQLDRYEPFAQEVVAGILNLAGIDHIYVKEEKLRVWLVSSELWDKYDYEGTILDIITEVAGRHLPKPKKPIVGTPIDEVLGKNKKPRR